MPAPLELQTVVSMPFAENTYIVWRKGRNDAVVFDPGLQPELILEVLQAHGLQVAAIVNTHGHADHIGGNAALKEAFPEAPIIIGANDAVMLTDADANLSAPFGMAITSPPADRTVAEGDTIDVAGLSFEVRDVPGHSPGHVALVYRSAPILVFGGDVLFRSGIGRTDFPGGSLELLLSGIREKLFTLPEDTVVYPGHGPVTKVGYEKRTNPFLK